MATYRSKRPFTFRSDHSTYEGDAKDSFTWEYSTVSDSFCITRKTVDQFCGYTGRKFESSEKQQWMGPQEAHALYELLKDYVETDI